MCRWGVSSSDLFLCLPFFDVLVYVQNKRADSGILRGLLGTSHPSSGVLALLLLLVMPTGASVEPVNLVPVRKQQGVPCSESEGQVL